MLTYICIIDIFLSLSPALICIFWQICIVCLMDRDWLIIRMHSINYFKCKLTHQYRAYRMHQCFIGIYVSFTLPHNLSYNNLLKLTYYLKKGVWFRYVNVEFKIVNSAITKLADIILWSIKEYTLRKNHFTYLCTNKYCKQQRLFCCCWINTPYSVFILFRI